MGDSTGSMFYFFVWIILLYVVGMGIYTIFTQLKKRRKQRRLNGESPSGQDPALPPRGDSPDAQP